MVHDASVLKKHLDTVASLDPDIAFVLEKAGYPEPRKGEEGFATFARIIIGQQLSTKVAQTISNRLLDAAGDVFEPDVLASLSDEAYQTAGISRQKRGYLRSLAEAVQSGNLPVEDLSVMDDEAAISAITRVKGLGRWSAEMYLMFSLGRPDIWPVDDLAVATAVQRMKCLKEKPKTKDMMRLAEPWRPMRSSVALLMWHGYAKNAFPD